MQFSEGLELFFPPKMFILESRSVSPNVFILIDNANPCAKNWR